MDWITDDKGDILVDYIGKFENLQEEFDIICKKLNIPKIILPHVNKDSSKESYKNYYTSESMELINKAFEKDIKQFNYKF